MNVFIDIEEGEKFLIFFYFKMSNLNCKGGIKRVNLLSSNVEYI